MHGREPRATKALVELVRREQPELVHLQKMIDLTVASDPIVEVRPRETLADGRVAHSASADAESLGSFGSNAACLDHAGGKPRLDQQYSERPYGPVQNKTRPPGKAGPRGIRLQEIAADVGVSHSTILHHFGSREALVEAVVTRALDGLQQKLVASFSEQEFGSADGDAVFRQVMATLGDRGHARLMAWLALEGRADEDPAKMLLALSQIMHARRLVMTKLTVPIEDTLFVTLLGALALFAEGVLGDSMFDSAGLGKDSAARARFHAWFLKLIDHHLRGPGLIDPPPPKDR